MEMLRERKRKILQHLRDRRGAGSRRPGAIANWAQQVKPPEQLRERFQRAFGKNRLYELERLWYRAGRRAAASSPGSWCS